MGSCKQVDTITCTSAHLKHRLAVVQGLLQPCHHIVEQLLVIIKVGYDDVILPSRLRTHGLVGDGVGGRRGYEDGAVLLRGGHGGHDDGCRELGHVWGKRILVESDDALICFKVDQGYSTADLCNLFIYIFFNIHCIHIHRVD